VRGARSAHAVAEARLAAARAAAASGDDGRGGEGSAHASAVLEEVGALLELQALVATLQADAGGTAWTTPALSRLLALARVDKTGVVRARRPPRPGHAWAAASPEGLQRHRTA